MSIEKFIRTEVKTVDNLRTLLLLHSNPTRELDVMEVSGQLYLRPETAAEALATLAAKGILVVTGDPPRYRYQPQTNELAQWIAQIAQIDREQPVTLINLIYAQPKNVQAFADAFRFRKKEEH